MDLASPITVILITVFTWWLTTGTVLFLNRLNGRTFPISFMGGVVVLGLSLYGLYISRDMATLEGALIAFLSAVGAWGFVELTFYLGYITGPRRVPCKPGCSGIRHFGHAIQISLYHELLIIAITGLAAWMILGHENTSGLWAFVILWTAHESARLNVFLGVRNISEDWVPTHLPFLKSFLKQRAMNLFFPISQMLGIPVFLWLINVIETVPTGSFDATVLIFLSSLLGLAIVEHWFLILPIPLTGLWRWWLKGADTLAGGDTPTTTAKLKREMSSSFEQSSRVAVTDLPDTGNYLYGSAIGAHPVLGPSDTTGRIFSVLGR